MKLEKFNLQDALNGRPVVMRNGSYIIFGGYNKDARPRYRIIGWDKSDGVAMQWHEDGVFSFNRDEDSESDLFHPAEEKKPRTFWVNEYKFGMGDLWEHEINAEREKDKSPMNRNNYITTHKIEIP